MRFKALLALMLLCAAIVYLYEVNSSACPRGVCDNNLLIVTRSIVENHQTCDEIDVLTSKYCHQLVVLKRVAKLPLFSAYGKDFGRRRRMLLLTKEQELIEQKHEHNAMLVNQSNARTVEMFHECNKYSALAVACAARTQITRESLDSLDANTLRVFKSETPQVEAMRQLLVSNGSTAIVRTKHFTLQLLSSYNKSTNASSLSAAGQCFYATDKKWRRKFVGGPAIRVIHTDSTIRCYPNVLIIGVQKGATTELRNALIRGNRETVKAIGPWKIENHILETASSAYAAKNSYLSTMAISPSQFFNMQVLLDKTPAYFHDDDAKLTLFDNIHMVVLLRDPAQRMYSGYWNMCLIKFQSARNCSNEKMERMVLVNKTSEDLHEIKMSMVGYYDEHLVRIAEQFNSAGVRGNLFISFDDHFKENGTAYFDRLSKFLDVNNPTLIYPAEETASSPDELKFNSMRATGYSKPNLTNVDRIRREIYGESLRRLHSLLQPDSILFSNPKFRVVVDRYPDLPSWFQP